MPIPYLTWSFVVKLTTLTNLVCSSIAGGTEVSNDSLARAGQPSLCSIPRASRFCSILAYVTSYALFSQLHRELWPP